MTKTKLTRTQMIDRLSDWWTNEMEDMSTNDLRQLAHSLMMQSLQARSTPDLIDEIDEIITTDSEIELTDEEDDESGCNLPSAYEMRAAVQSARGTKDDSDTAWGRARRSATEDLSAYEPCFDCGSPFPHRHTPLCALAAEGDRRDLPQIPGTQHFDKDQFTN